MIDRTPQIVGYARVSTQGQDLTYQLKKLETAGCSRIFREKRSGKNCTDRPQLRRMLRSLAAGDLVLATTTDRVARDPLDLLNILHAVRKAGAGLRLLDEPFIDTTSEMADLVLFLVGWAARWQRWRILENTAQGRALARERGVQFGRPPKLTDEQRGEIRRAHHAGTSLDDMARDYEVSVSTIIRVIG